LPFLGKKKLLGGASGFAQPKIRSTQKSIWINLFAQLNPGFGGNNYLLNWGTAPRSLVFIGGFLWVSVVYAALLSGFGVLWWVSVMLVSFLLGFGVFLTGFGVFWGFPGVSSHCALLSVFFAQRTKMLNYFIRSTQRHPIII
jgi:hypothetical protein